MKSVVYSIGFILINLAFSASAQDTLYHFWFNAQSKSQIDKLSTAISIDNVDGTRVDAYANRKEFEVFKSFNLPYSFITESKSTKALTMATTIADMANWDRYPTYEVYEQMMQNFAQNYPEICQLVEIGTLASGRKLWAVKISDQVENSWDPEPSRSCSRSASRWKCLARRDPIYDVLRGESPVFIGCKFPQRGRSS